MLTAFEQTENWIQQMVDDQLIPGASYAIINQDQLLVKQAGVAQIKPNRQAIWPNALYDLASVTKVVGTTTLAVQLHEQSRLAWDEPVQTYLPEFTDPTVTVRNLLTHTAGISGYIPRRNQLPDDQLLAAILKLPIGHNLNHRVVYTDLGLILVGLICERLTGLPVQQAITERVIKPLGLPQATFAPRVADCVPTTYRPRVGLLKGTVHDPKARVLGKRCGSAGLFASVADLTRFSRFMLGQLEVPAVLKPETIAALYADATPGGKLRRGLGWNLWHGPRDQRPLLFHTGFTGTLLLLDREHQQALIFLSNRVHPQITPAENRQFPTARGRLIRTFLGEAQTAWQNAK